MTPSSWPAKFSLLALALAFHSISVVNADDHLKPRSIWSRRHRDIGTVRRQVLAGGSLPVLVAKGPFPATSETLDPLPNPDHPPDGPSGSQPTTPLFLVGEPTSVDPATFPLSTSQPSAVSGPNADPTPSTDPTPTADSKSSTDSSPTTDPTPSTEPSPSAVSKSSTDSGPTTDSALDADSTLSTEPTPSTDSSSSPSSSPSSNSNSSADVDNILSQILSFLTASESSTPEATSDPLTPTPTPTPTPASIPTSPEPSTPNTDSAPSTPVAVDSTVVPSISSEEEVTSAKPLLPDLPILSDFTKSAQATSDDSQVPSAPTPSTDSAPSTPAAVDSTVVPSISSEEATSATPLLPDLPILSDLTKSAQATSDDSQVPSAPTPTLDAPPTLVDTVTSSSTTDDDGALLSSIFAIISSIVDPPSSTTSETPLVIPDLPILTQSSTSETPFLDLPTSLPATNQPLVSLDLPGGSSTSEPPLLSIDLPISSSTIDFPPSSSTSRDGVVITDPPTSSTVDSFISSGTGLPPTISSNSGNDILSLNISSFLPGNPSAIDTDDVTTVSSSASISVSIRSEFNYLTASSLDIVPIPTTSTSVTNTNPDAPLTSVGSAAETDGAVTGTVSAVPVPTNLPQFIKPSDQSDPVDPNSNPDGYMLITILFEHEVGWTAVLSKSEIAGAIMAWVPGLVTAILGITDKDLKLVGLKAYAGPDYQASQNVDDIQTMLLFYLKTDQVQTLKSYYTTSGSVFYTTGNTVTKQLTALCVKTYPIAATMDPHNGTQNSTDNPTSTTVDNGRRNAIIAVCVTFGTIALGVFIWWAVKTRQQRRDAAHRRLSYQSAPNYGATGAPRLMAERGNNNNNNNNNNSNNSGGGGGAARRNSFYAFGQDNDGLEDETFDYISQHSQGGSGGHGPPVRRPVAGQTISQPILRETSMGQW